MDNSPVRHGRPSSHIKYGEGLATLVGDALQPLAFQMITSSPLTDSVKVKLIKELAIASGKEGMVAGQVMDILSPETELNLEQLTQLHKLKTGELLAFSCGAPALIAGLSDQDCHGFKLFGYHLGLLYQVTDDLLDAGSNDIGKPTGQDLNKKTILTFMSTNKAIEYCEQLTDQAITALPESYRDKLRPIIKDIQNRII
jgi:geranylgeranyl pyrophosphate synthase